MASPADVQLSQNLVRPGIKPIVEQSKQNLVLVWKKEGCEVTIFWRVRSNVSSNVCPDKSAQRHMRIPARLLLWSTRLSSKAEDL